MVFIAGSPCGRHNVGLLSPDVFYLFRCIAPRGAALFGLEGFMIRHVTSFVAACCGLMLLAAFGSAQPNGSPDKDKKNFFFGGPKNEVRKVVAQFDKDGDGRLNSKERTAAREFLAQSPGGKGGKGGGFPGGPGGFGPGMFLAKPIFEALDSDSDGKVTAKEAEAGIAKFFEAADKANKKELTEAQMSEAISSLMPPPKFGPGGEPKKENPGQGKEGFPKKGPGGFGGFGPGTMLAPAVVKKADANKDGKVTLQELQNAAKEQFKEADKNKDGSLSEAELGEAINKVMSAGGGFRMPFGPGGKERNEPGKPGPKVSPSEVKSYPDANLYDPTVLRTFFLEFENKDWEPELAAFYKTDVEVPATLTVDGMKYENVGVHFRGMSSFFAVQAGSKRSMNLSLDFVDNEQRLYGQKTINLLNSHDDPTFLHTVLYSHIARKHLPTPNANFVKLVINGESWGVYVDAQQFNKDFIRENFKTGKGARWKVQGSPGGQGGLNYIGDTIADYKRHYSIKSNDDDNDWKALIELCRTLDKTPLDKLEEALKPILDIDGALWFLALDVALINSDGYWIRASDYTIYRDPKGIFHLVPHDMNECFGPAMGPGMGGFGKGGKDGGPKEGKGGNSPVALDPLVGLEDARKPLRSRLLAVPSLRKKYLEYVARIAEEDLDWKNLGPIVKQYRDLIDREIELDTRKLTSLEAFRRLTADEPARGEEDRGRSLSLRQFADARREYLLNHPEIRKLRGEK